MTFSLLFYLITIPLNQLSQLKTEKYVAVILTDSGLNLDILVQVIEFYILHHKCALRLPQLWGINTFFHILDAFLEFQEGCTSAKPRGFSYT